MAGRRPIPNHLHLIRGTGRADRHSLADAPQSPARKRPNPPAHLTDAAKACWRKLCVLLSDMGVLTAADMIALERTCAVYADVVRLQGVLEILGETYDTKSVTGETMVRARPQRAMLADADRRLAAYLSHFGLTPATRTKVRIPSGKRRDPLEHYFTER
jgi:P27 family predicted phage terminase small subunit